MNEWEVISWIITTIQKKYVISNAFCTRKYKQSDWPKISEIIITKMTNWCLRWKDEANLPETGQNGSNKELIPAS